MMPYASYAEAPLTPSQCDRRLVFMHEPHGPWAEQYRRIASRVVSKHPNGGILMVTSPTPEDGKTLSALNLAFCLAERGPALLVDLDTRHCSVRGRLGLSPMNPSIEDALLGMAHPEECVLSIPRTRLCVSSNRGDSNALIELLAAGRPEKFLAWAQHKFLWVIFDTPPVFPIADTLEIARHTTVGMLVVRSRKTPSRLVKQAFDSLKSRLHFVLLNDADAPSYAMYDRCYYFGQATDDRSWK